MTANADCPRCHSSIPMEDISVSTDIALCRRCEERWNYSNLLTRKDSVAVVAQAPGGAWHTPAINGFEVGASTRSPLAFFLVPFMCVWSGFSLNGIYGSQIVSGKFNLGTSLFGIPFVLGTLLLGSAALMAVCGKVVVTVRGREGRVFTGVGPLGRTRRFDWSQVSAITEDWNYSRRGQGTQYIAITAERKIKIYALNTDRHRYMLAVLNYHWQQP
ncbi:hypothetical protein [Prosthecobacter sp.]|uniref:hypothetical protein n=1 Tax=Prosthecobacter sp. TaxID=1965333 RepID=UPI00248734C8|nr:hypothetical protein [Prosthecobacter sp.]MDI1314727.1 hypothetical protein [Prosthecobacter sp.]